MNRERKNRIKWLRKNVKRLEKIETKEDILKYITKEDIEMLLIDYENMLDYEYEQADRWDW